MNIISPTQDQWIPCDEPETGDIIRWKEPIWAAPNKPRGKPDQIGEQMVVANLLNKGEFYELAVRAAEKISSINDEPLKVKGGDTIRRKETSIMRGECHKLVQE